MPNIQQLPAAQPQDIRIPGPAFQQPRPDFGENFDRQLQQVREDLHNQWNIEMQALQNTWFPSKQHYDTAKAKLMAKYQMKDYEARRQLEAQTAEQQMVRQLVTVNTRGMPAEEQATLRMQLGPEAERIVFAPTPRPLSPSQLGSPALQRSVHFFADTAPDIPGWEWGPPKKTGEGLLRAYTEWKDTIGYDYLNPVQQRQYDRAWDLFMQEDKRFVNWQNPEIQANVQIIRSRGDISDIMRQKALGAKSPLARGIAREPNLAMLKTALPAFGIPAIPKQAEVKVLDVETARKILDEAGGNKELARQIAKSRGYKL